MISVIAVNAGRFVLLVLLQVLVLNDIHFFQIVNPYLYVAFVLLLPFETPKSLLMVLGMAIGFTVDIFSNTLGLHTSACIFLAFCRPYMLRLIAPREGYEFGMRPHVQSMGFSWFLIYAGSLILLHHLWFFTIEAFRFSALPTVLLNTLISGGITLVLVLLSQFLTFKAKSTV